MTGGARGSCRTPVAAYGRGNRYRSPGGQRLRGRIFRGYGNRFAMGNPADELDLMRTAAGRLKATLQTISAHIDEMEKRL